MEHVQERPRRRARALAMTVAILGVLAALVVAATYDRAPVISDELCGPSAMAPGTVLACFGEPAYLPEDHGDDAALT